MNPGVRQIRKRDGSIVSFDKRKIEQAIVGAVEAVGGTDVDTAARLAEIVAEEIKNKFHKNSIPAVEEIQDLVEKVLINEGHAKTAKAYILYRQKRAELRHTKQGILGFLDTSKLSLNGAIIAKARYLQRDESDNVTETPLELFRRVAKHLAAVERRFDKKADVKGLEGNFYEIMSSLKFLPAGRTLANASTNLNQLANAFVVPIYDSVEDIFQAMKETAIIHKAGGGTGFDFSKLRQKGAKVHGGAAAGPLTYLKLFDASSAAIKVGSRQSSNMGILRVDHPDILDFIQLKSRGGLTTFNISVALTDEFMRAAVSGREYGVHDPRTGDQVRKASARQVLDLLIATAWQTGEPGVLFIDRINKLNPTSHVGRIEATSACAETPLHPYEASNLGSINLDRFVRKGKVDWDELERVTMIAVHMLDNVIDSCMYPIDIVEKTTKQMRRIGLGVMGLADMFYQLGLPYDSEEAVRLGRRVMRFISDAASEKSSQLAQLKGDFPLYRGSLHHKNKTRRRNATLTAIAPTGSLSMLAETSSGIEPSFALCYVKRVLDGKEFLYVNRHFEKVAQERGFYSETLMRKIAQAGSLEGLDEVPDDVKSIFKVSHQIDAFSHVRMQAAFQKYVESAISKTVNFPNSATIKDVEEAYMLAHKEGCKGITIYRDRSKEGQVIDVPRDSVK